jgi:hypothetical protein
MMLGRELESGSILTRAQDESGPLSEQSVAHLQKTIARERVQKIMAGATGLEPAASGVTGRRSNQLSYAPNIGNASD